MEKEELKLEISKVNSYSDPIEAIDRAEDDFTDFGTYVSISV